MKPIIILGIESSCDDTAAAVISNKTILSNVVSSQDVHIKYGGVVPELASRAHQLNIVPTVYQALQKANIRKNDLSAISFTLGPGLLGSLLVGASFAKSMSLALNIPLIEVNHMQGHIFANFIEGENFTKIQFPFLCLTVSGGHTQIVLVRDYFDMEILGETLDDAAGEAFDKIGKIFGLDYPSGSLIDKYSKMGDENKFKFPIPKLDGIKYSFSGIKTSVLYFIQKNQQLNPNFIEENKYDLCASVQKTIVDTLINKLKEAIKITGVRRIAIAGGVSANSKLREEILNLVGCEVYIPSIEYTTDNAAMIAMVGSIKYQRGIFSNMEIEAQPRYKL